MTGGLLVLLLALVVVDRVVAARVRQAVADAFTARVEQPVGEPHVEVGGFPLLGQLVSGEVDDVDLRLDGATLGGVVMTDLSVDAQGVSTTGPHAMHTLDVQATVPVASVQDVVTQRTDLDVEVGVEGGELQLSGTALGLPLVATLVPHVVDGRLLVDLASVSVGGVGLDPSLLPADLAGRLTDLAVPIEGLPEGLVLTDAVVHPDGLRITASGTDVTVTPAPTPAP